MQIFIGAPPRSGNTYLRYILKDAYIDPVDVRGAHDIHSAIAHVNDEDSPITFVTSIRNPVDIATSRLVWLYAEGTLDSSVETLFPALEEITCYWELVLARPDKFCILDFKDVTGDKNLIVDKIDKRYPELVKFKTNVLATESFLKESLTREDQMMFDKDSGMLQARGHLPRGESEFRPLVLRDLSNVAYKKRLEYLNSMYDQLLKLAL